MTKLSENITEKRGNSGLLTSVRWPKNSGTYSSNAQRALRMAMTMVMHLVKTLPRHLKSMSLGKNLAMRGKRMLINRRSRTKM
jgi:hypothetical protein